MDMYFIELHAVPKRDHPEAESVGGAYVNCWIEASGLEQAVARAQEVLTEVGWQPGDTVRSFPTRREYYTGDDDGLEYFEQALVDKEVFVFHRYPIEDKPEQ